MTFSSIEDIKASGLTGLELSKAIRQFRTTQSLNKQLDVKGISQAAREANAYSESQVSGVKLLNELKNLEALTEQIPHKAKAAIQPKNPNLPNYLTVGRDRQISGVVNDFLSMYLTKKNPGSFDKEWNFFKANAPKVSGDVYSHGLEHTARQTVAMLNKRYSGKTTQPLTGYKYQGNVGQFDGLPMNLSSLISQDKSKTIIFTGRNSSQQALSNSASKIFDTFKGLKEIDYMTTTGVVKMRRGNLETTQSSSRQSLTTVNGPAKDYEIKSTSGMSDLVAKYKSNNSTTKYSNLAVGIEKYYQGRDKLDAGMKRQLEGAVGLAVANLGNGRSDTRVNKVLDMNVKDFRNFANQFDSYHIPPEWNTYDHLSMRDVMSTQGSLGAQKAAERQSATDQGLRNRAALGKAYRLAKDLGIDKSVIAKETVGKLLGKGKGTFRNAMKATESLGEINSFLEDSVLQRDVLKREYPNRENFLKLYTTNPGKAAQHVFNNLGNHDVLNNIGLLDESSMNPILNTKGKIQQRFLEHTAVELMTRRKLPNMKIDGEFLNILTERRPKHTEQILNNVHAKMRWKKTDKGMETKLSAQDALNDFVDNLDSRQEDLDADRKRKTYDKSEFEYLNNQKLREGEEYTRDRSKGYAGGLVLQDAETKYDTDKLVDKMKLEGFSGSDKELAKMVQDKISVKQGKAIGQSLSQELFEGPDDNNKFRNLKGQWKKGRLSPNDFLMLTEAYNAYEGGRPSNSKEMFLGLAKREHEFLFSSGEGSKKDPWIKLNHYLRNKSTFGAGKDRIEEYMSLGLLDMKQKTSVNPNDPKPKNINYDKVLNNKSTVIKLPGTPSYVKANNTLLNYLDPKKGKLIPGQAAVLSKLHSNTGVITNVESEIARLIRKDRDAEAVHNKLMSDGKTFDSYKSSISKENIISSLVASQGIGSEDYGKQHLSEFNAQPKNIRLTESMADTLNKNDNIIKYTNDKNFRSRVEKELLSGVGSPEIFGEAGLTKKSLMLDNFEGHIDKATNLSKDKRIAMKLIGEELYAKYEIAQKSNPIQTAALHQGMNNYFSDVGFLLRDSKDDSPAATDKRAKLLARFSKSAEGHTALDNYYAPVMKKLISSGSNIVNLMEGSTPGFRFNQISSDDQKKSKSIAANLGIAGMYGETFLGKDYVPKANADARAYELERMNRSTWTLEGALNSKAGLKTSETAAVVRDKRRQYSNTEYDTRPSPIENYAVKTHKPGKIDKFKRWFFANPLRLSEGAKIPGNGHKDEVPALLTKGETVIDKHTSKALGINTQDDYLRFKSAAKAGKVQFYEDGDIVDELRKKRQEAREKANVVDSLDSKIDSVPKTTPNDLVMEARSEVEKLTSTTEQRSLDTDKFNEKLRISKMSDITEGMRKQGSSNAESKNLFEAMDQYTGDKSNSINDVLAGDRIYNADEGKAFQSVANDAGTKAKIKATTETSKANMIKMIADSTSEDLAKAAKDPAKRAAYMDALGSPGTIVDPELSKKLGTARNNMAKVIIPEYDDMVSMGAESKGNYTQSQQQAIDKLSSQDKSDLGKITGTGFTKSFTGDAKVTNLEKHLNRVANNIDDFNRIFKTDFKAPKTDKDLLAMGDKISGMYKDGFGVSSKLDTAKDMRKAKDLLRSTAYPIDKNAEGGLDKQNKLDEMGAQIGSAQHLKESSKMRWSSFGDLMVQNAAFGASYGVIGGAMAAITGGAAFVTGLDERLHNLQAITGATGAELEQMAGSVKMVSTETKFSANEIADAATILGQAGFSAQDIKQSLGGVVKLATATGSALEDATQTLTSALTIWDAPMRDSTKYADEFTAAINQSKLDIKSLSLALQYTGNIAAQGGVPVEDVLTITSLMKDAGIKQGSTVGTGQRLVYSDLLAPSSKFAKSLSSIGISKGQLSENFEEGGVIQALKLMRDQGFGFGQATRGMEVRERSAYMAMVNQLDKAELFRANIMVPGAADAANETQMKAFNNRFKNMVNSWGIGLDEMVNQKTGVIGNALDLLTYNPGEDKTHPFDIGKGESSYDLLTRDKESGSFGNKAMGAIALGAGGLAAYKGMKYYDSLASKGDAAQKVARNSRNLKLSQMNKLNPAGFKGFKLPGAIGLGSLAIGSAISDDPLATFLKEGAPMAVGGALGAGASIFTGGVGGLAGFTLGHQGFKATVGDSWNNAVDSMLGLNKPTQLEVLEDVNTRYSSAASTTDDIAKYRLMLDRQDNNPLRYREDSTSSQKEISQLAVRGQGRIFNQQFKKDIDFLKKEKGIEYDFSMFKNEEGDQGADKLESMLGRFNEEIDAVWASKLDNMYSGLHKASENFEEFDTEDLEKTTNRASGKFRRVLNVLANVAPENLATQYARLQEVAINNGKAVKAHVLKLGNKDDIDKAYKSNVASGVKTEYNILNKKAEAKIDASVAKDLVSLQEQLLTGHATIKSSGKLKTYRDALYSMPDDQLSVKQRVEVAPLIDKKNEQLVARETGIDKWEAKFSELTTKVSKVNDAFKDFYRNLVKTGGEKITSLSRTQGQGNLIAASDLASNWKSLGSMRKVAGLQMMEGGNADFFNFLNTSPSADKSKGTTEFYNEKVRPNFTNSMLRNANYGATAQLNTMNQALDTTKDISIPTNRTDIKDPSILRAFMQRENAFEDMGFNRGSSEMITGLNDMSVQDALAGPLSGDLPSNMNEIFNRKAEISKEFKIKELKIQEAKITNMKIGTGDGVFDADSSEQGRAQAKRTAAYDRSVDTEGRQVAFQMAKATTNFNRQMEKLETNTAFQEDTLAINYGNQQAAMARKYDFQVALAEIQKDYKLTDAGISRNYKQEDLGTKTSRAIEDLNKSMTRKTEDLLKSFDRQVKAINTGFTRQIDSIERTRQDTIDFFDRSMDRPTNITLKPDSFLKIADVMNDNTLAIDAHKATLSMNTGAIQQLISIQTSKEDIVKDAYKYAYKGVGGEVYDENGELNEDFTTMYDDYLARNNESLLDSVLDNAVNSTFGGSGFNINQALTDASYIAAQVLDPSVGVTTESLVEGSGYTTDELVEALIGTGSGEVRITTTQGIVLEAQGDLAGAIFDLETQMMKYDIQLREAGISFQNALEDGALNLSYSLEDLDLSHARGLEDISLNFSRGMDDIQTNFSREIDQINLAHARNLEMMSLNYQFQIQEAAIKFDEALMALSRQEAFNKEQMAKSLEDVFADIAENSEFKLGEMSINNDLNQGLIDLQFSQLIETLNLTTEGNIAALDTQFTMMLQKLHLDAGVVASALETSLKRATIEKRIDLAFLLASIQSGINEQATEMKWKFDGLIKSTERGFDELYTNQKWIDVFNKAGVDIASLSYTGISNGLITTLETESAIYNAKILDKFKASEKILYDGREKVTNNNNQAIANLVLEGAKAFEGAIQYMGAQTLIASNHIATLAQVQTASANYAQGVATAMNNALSRIMYYENLLANQTSYVPTTTDDTPTTGYTSGVVLPGYGGGDIIPTMLEPGEAVIKKETVRIIGKSYFEALNNPSAGTILTRPDEISNDFVSLPSTVSSANKSEGTNNFSVGINVTTDTTIATIENNMEQIADGVRRVFQEYV